MYLQKILIAILLLPSLSLSQISGGGGLGPGAIGGGKVNSSLSGQLGGIVNKNIFSNVGKKKTTNSTKFNPKKNSKNSGTNSQKTVGKSKAAKRPATRPGTVTTDIQTDDSSFGVINFQPTGDTQIDQVLADMLTTKADEKEALITIFSETKKAFDEEAQKLGRRNDLALVFTFFISACVTVYHDSPEPTEEATESLYQTIAELLNESPDIAQMSNEDKNITADKLIYISGLIYAGYLTGKQTQDIETTNIYRQTAGICLESLIGLSPETLKFDKNGLIIS